MSELRKILKAFLLLQSIAFISIKAQDIKTVAGNNKQSSSRNDASSILIYTRTITDANGNLRFDQNLVPNIKLTGFLRLEVGFRQGERSQKIGAYNHYKIELQTKYFFKTVRFIGRLSDNVVRYTSPIYSKSNYLFIAESKFPISTSFQLLASFGYVFSYQQDNLQEALPSLAGRVNNYPTYKIALRYLLNDKGFVEAVYGAYDVFNPYLLATPFTQLSFDHEINEKFTFYSYFRYQFNERIDAPLNDFLGLGVRLHLAKQRIN